MNTSFQALGAAVIALLVAGCGGSDKKTSDDGVRGYAQTGQALDSICKQASAETDPISKQANGSAKHDRPLLEKLVAVNDKYIAKVKQVKPDAKLQDAFDRYTAALDALSAKQKELLDVVKQGDDTAYQTYIKALSGPGKDAHRLARALGAPECAKS